MFLHFNRATRKLKIGEKIEAFLYYDQKKRLCATMEKPLITTKKLGFVEVVNICDGGVFVNIGIAKDILLSNDYLPNNKLAWPKVSEKLPCILKAKKDQLVAKIINKDDLKNLKIEPLSTRTKVTATVCRLLSDGIGLYTNTFQYIYVHKSMMRKKYHLGEIVDVDIININKDGEANGSFIKQKELARFDDSKIILNYLETMGGIIHLGNASSPEEIKKIFPNE
ncbi:MAG: S1-like domain-containing RNA-binding protein [Bacilli bacterium]